MLSCLGGAPRNVKAIRRDVPIRRDDLDEMQHAKKGRSGGYHCSLDYSVHGIALNLDSCSIKYFIFK